MSAAPYDTCNLGDHVGDAPAAVAENRVRVADALGAVPAERIVWLRQVHGTRVHVAAREAGTPGVGACEADEPEAVAPEADAVVTAARGLPLAILTADCAPIAIACDDAVGVVHAGHRGLEHGVVEAAVGALRAIGHGPVRAYLGPCIRPARYEFGEDDLARLVDRLGPQVAARTSAGRPALDIPAAVRGALERSGVHELGDGGICTAASERHFSHRRDGTTGRQATIIVLPSR